MANELINQIVINDNRIEFNGFPLFPETGTISVFHTENSFTIYPYEKSGTYYTSFEIVNKAIDKGLGAREYIIFRAMIEEIKVDSKYLFVEFNDIYLIIPE